jgi:monofunctional biosynthetic peptidoglycan transglycosylase
MFWRFLHWRYKKSKRPGAADEPHRLRFLWRLSIWTVRIFMFIVIVDLFYVANIWPDWERLKTSAVPKSRFMHVYARERKKHKNWPYRRWSRVPMEKIPAHVSRAVIVGEDSRFYEHGGFDFLAFRDAMGRNVEVGRMRYGASTISQQTVKNLFLSSTRTPLRKWHELLITWGMERHLSKRRILEIYLNIAEFGLGIYGVEAASQHYWGKSVDQLSYRQAAQLAACLPSPRKHNPATATKAFQRRVDRVFYWLTQVPSTTKHSKRKK